MSRSLLALTIGLSCVVSSASALNSSASDSGATEPLLHLRGQVPIAQVERVFAAGPPAAVILSQLAPAQLIAWPRNMQQKQLELLPPVTRDLPALGSLAGRGSTVSMEQLVALQADLIVDVGDVNAHYLSMAERVNQSTGIAYALLSGRLAQSPQQYRELGRLLGQEQRAEELAQAAEVILREAEALRQQGVAKGKRFYMARSADGLETGLSHSIHTELLRTLGIHHVADELAGERLARVSMEQVLLWQPDVILTHSEAFLATVYEHPLWRKVPAVQKQQVYLVPSLPFGSLDEPPGVNRLLGLLWLSQWLKQAPEAEQIAKIREFYRLFYVVSLDDEQIRSFLIAPVIFDER
ncbi:ABC transporter substrate-binding protein [Oligella urethralis]|uniref:ABC transporter substrate-binding protein n=2 Tax=Oligella urethralis TaxID=90245 RepID=UPI00288BAB81|nr:ABC transporter substrate-binding protein [Oligella urethralis]